MALIKSFDGVAVTESNKANPSTDLDYEVRSLDSICVNETELKHPWYYNFTYIFVGIIFGIVFVKAEIISWVRMQEMFRFQNFHMFGVMGTAVLTGAASIWLIKKFNIRTIHGEPVRFQKKRFHKGQVLGGLLFGLGWGMTGICPGPIFALIGSGAFVVLIIFLSAIAGTWVYGLLRDQLPH